MWCILINQTLNVNVEQKNMPTTDACVRVFHTTISGELKQRIAYWHVQIRREYFFESFFSSDNLIEFDVLAKKLEKK